MRAQERMSARKEGKRDKRQDGQTRQPGGGANATTSDKLDSIFKGLLS